MERPGPTATAWMLAIPAILTQLNTASHAHLGGGPKGTIWQKHATSILKDSWGITSREELAGTIDALRSGGTDAEYRRYLASYAATSAADRAADRKFAFVEEHRDQLGDSGLLAWDLGRVVALAGWGALSGICSEDDAWTWIVPAAKRLQRAYTSWEDLGEGYTLGCKFWNPTHEKGCREMMVKLAAPGSPWKTIPWRTDLDETEASAASAAWRRGLVKKAAGMVVSAIVAGLFGLGVLVIGGVIVGYLAYSGAFSGVTAAVGDASGGPNTVWDGTAPLLCGGREEIRVAGVTATLLGGAAIVASEHCTLTLTDVDVTATTALLVGGNATVTISGGRLAGKDHAIQGDGNASVTMSGTTIEGPITTSQNVKVTGP